MAEKIDQQAINEQARSDEESCRMESKELRRKKRIKCIVLFIIVQIIQTLILSLTVMRVRTPKVRLGTVTFPNLVTGTQFIPYFDLTMMAQIKVKNRNFGPYKFESTNATFTFQGVTVGHVLIPEGKAGFLSTEKVSVTLNMSSNALMPRFSRSLGSELGAGVLTLNSQAKLSGKVTLMLVIKKKRSAQMNCTLAINLSAKTIQDLNCR
ncbi:late embryogenesis abundant protein At1g64065-like [Juglans regia]|uniref:Late embryogenesis abundant protein At1g64065-like n=2 Tax=Juglans regia TaxID=51240 RepID=A0A2I4FBP0_JUGRE|nr:late embryogenesis abundant protein At1g64065-like [Juglans regia]